MSYIRDKIEAVLRRLERDEFRELSALETERADIEAVPAKERTPEQRERLKAVRRELNRLEDVKFQRDGLRAELEARRSLQRQPDE